MDEDVAWSGMQLDRRPRLETDAVCQHHHADGGATAKAAFGAEHLEQQIGQAGGDFVDLGIVRGADDKAQGAHDAFHPVGRACGLTDAASRLRPSRLRPVWQAAA